MTDLEKAVANALRLSDSAANKLLTTIQRNINTARAELIRSGVSKTVVNATQLSPLVEDTIITYCMMKMDDETNRDANSTAFLYQQDNLRKSYPQEEATNA